MNNDKTIILASSSPYRQQLLNKLQIDFTAKSPEIDESPYTGESGIAQAKRLAKQKTFALSNQFRSHLIIGSDQVVLYEQKRLPKPGNRDSSIRQLQTISGNTVDFYTSICVLNSQTQEFSEDIDHCSVTFRKLLLAEIEKYVALDRPYNCAGSFKSEGLGIALIETISGEDPNALIGLPLIKLITLLKNFGVKIL